MADIVTQNQEDLEKKKLKVKVNMLIDKAQELEANQKLLESEKEQRENKIKELESEMAIKAAELKAVKNSRREKQEGESKTDRWSRMWYTITWLISGALKIILTVLVCGIVTLLLTLFASEDIRAVIFETLNNYIG